MTESNLLFYCTEGACYLSIAFFYRIPQKIVCIYPGLLLYTVCPNKLRNFYIISLIAIVFLCLNKRFNGINKFILLKESVMIITILILIRQREFKRN